MRVITTSLFIGMAAAFVPTGMRPTLHRITPTTLPVAAPIAAPIKPVAPKAIRIAPPATMLTGLEGPGLVTAVWTLIALNFMPLGPTVRLRSARLVGTRFHGTYSASCSVLQA